MQDILVVVDMQNDFIDGTLGTKEAIAIVPKVEEKIRNFKGTVLFTRDTHETWYLDTKERNFRYHTASGIQKDGRSEVNWISSEKQNRLIKILLVLQIWQMNWWQ